MKGKGKSVNNLSIQIVGGCLRLCRNVLTAFPYYASHLVDLGSTRITHAGEASVQKRHDGARPHTPNQEMDIIIKGKRNSKH